MPNVVPLFTSFSLGIKRDQGRDNVPDGAVWDSTDYIPDLEGPDSKRGGWSYASNDISSTTATASRTVAGAFPVFAAVGAKNCVIDEDGRFYTVTAAGVVTDVGAGNASTPTAPLAFHREKLIITRSDGTTAPGYFDGTTLGSLAGSPPAGIYGGVYKDFALLARTAANTHRIYFSDPGDPTVWDTANSYVDAAFPVTGVATLRNAILIFSLEQVERVIGNVPPPNSDFAKEPLWRPGCVDARSLVIYDDNVIFANQGGIFWTDGASVDDLTKKCGFLNSWRTLMAGWASTWTLAAGRHREWYLISVMDGATFKDAYLIDPRRGVHVRFSNINANMFWNSVGTYPEMFWANRLDSFICGAESMWNPAAANKTDADSTEVEPMVEFSWKRLALGRWIIREFGLAYDLRADGVDTPTLIASYVMSPESTDYTNVVDLSGSQAPLPATTKFQRSARQLGFETDGVGLKIIQNGASASTKLFSVDADVAGLAGNRYAAA